MPTKDEALKMAHKTFMQLKERTPRKEDGSGYFDKEINACKEALEQPAQENCAHIGMDKCPHKGICQYCKQPAQLFVFNIWRIITSKHFCLS